MQTVLYTKIFLVALFCKSLIESYLDRRNMIHIQNNRSAVPTKFAEVITLTDHQKAADYSVEKIKAAQIFHFFDLVIFLSWTLGGGLEFISQFSQSYFKNEIYAGLFFFLLLGIISSLLALPQSIYSTFVIEEKYGFNKTTWKIFITDLLKGGLLGIIIGGPIIYILLMIMQKLGQYWWLYAFISLAVFQLFLIFIFPRYIAPLFNKFNPLEDGEVKNKIVNLLRKCGFESDGLFVMDASKRSSHGNAYFTGFGKNKRIVFFDTLIKTLNANEIEAVLAHELGHMKKHHITKNLIKAFTMSLIGFYILGLLKNNTEFFMGHGVNTVNNYMALTLFSMVSGVYTFFITPISSYFSRKYEYEADGFASKYSSAKEMISALIKMYKDNASSLTPDPLYSKFYYSHPPALERVTHLEKFVIVDHSLE